MPVVTIARPIATNAEAIAAAVAARLGMARNHIRIADQDDIASRAHGFAHCRHAGIMASLARQIALLGPAAIAVHDDGDMARHLRRVGNCGGRTFENHKSGRNRR